MQTCNQNQTATKSPLTFKPSFELDIEEHTLKAGGDFGWHMLALHGPSSVIRNTCLTPAVVGGSALRKANRATGESRGKWKMNSWAEVYIKAMIFFFPPELQEVLEESLYFPCRIWHWLLSISKIRRREASRYILTSPHQNQKETLGTGFKHR